MSLNHSNPPQPPPPPPAAVPGPPPPPPVPFVHRALEFTAQNEGELGFGKCFQKMEISEEDVKKDISSFVTTKRWLNKGGEEGLEGKKCFIAVYSHVQPILQQGPVCGLVALSMAGNLIGAKCVDADKILAEASRRGYSKKGEIFSVDYMNELAGFFYPNCVCEVIDTRDEDCWEKIVDCLVCGNALLLPYDADFNHGPAMRNGHAAHWAIMHGILGVLDDGYSVNVATEETELNEFGGMTILSPEKIEETTRDLLKERFFNKNTFAICHQGKSTHTGIWRLEDFLRSNQNLKEIAPKLLSEHDSMILSDITKGLRNHAVLLKKPE